MMVAPPRHARLILSAQRPELTFPLDEEGRPVQEGSDMKQNADYKFETATSSGRTYSCIYTLKKQSGLGLVMPSIFAKSFAELCILPPLLLSRNLRQLSPITFNIDFDLRSVVYRVFCAQLILHRRWLHCFARICLPLRILALVPERSILLRHHCLNVPDHTLLAWVRPLLAAAVVLSLPPEGSAHLLVPRSSVQYGSL